MGRSDICPEPVHAAWNPWTAQGLASAPRLDVGTRPDSSPARVPGPRSWLSEDYGGASGPSLDEGTQPGCSPAWISGPCSWLSEGDGDSGPSLSDPQGTSLVLPRDTCASRRPPALSPSCCITSPPRIRASGQATSSFTHPLCSNQAGPGGPRRGWRKGCPGWGQLLQGAPRPGGEGGARSVCLWGWGTGATADVERPRSPPREAPPAHPASRRAPRYLLPLC